MKKLIASLFLAMAILPVLAFAGGSIQSWYYTRTDCCGMTNIFMDARTLPWNYTISRTGLPAQTTGSNPSCPARGTTREYSATELLPTVFDPTFSRWTDNPLSFFEYERGSATEKDGSGPSNRDGITDTMSSGFDGENVQVFMEEQLATPAASVVAVSLTTELAAECRFAGPFKAPTCSDGDTTSFPNGLDFNGNGVLDEPFSENFASLPVDGNGNFVNGPLVFQPGTIIDGDVAYNTPCVELSNDNAPATIDIYGVAVHENGHGHGLAHQLIRNTTMFPFVSDNVFSLQSPHSDDMISSALLYPVAGLATFASATTNTPARDGVSRQYEESTFLESNALGLIRGEVVDAAGRPIFAAHVFAVAVDVNTDPAKAPNAAVASLLQGLYGGGTERSKNNFDAIDPGDPVVGDYSGTLILGPNDSISKRYLAESPDPDRNDFVLANLLPGRYAIGIEAIDADPVSPASISGTVFSVWPGDPVVELAILPEFYSTDESGTDETQVAKVNSRAGNEPGTSTFELDKAPANIAYIDVAPGQRITGIRIVINCGVDGVGDEPDADSAFANDVPVATISGVAAAGTSASGQTVRVIAQAKDDGATIGSTQGLLGTSNVDETESLAAFLFTADGQQLAPQVVNASAIGQPADGRNADTFDASAEVTLGEGSHTVGVRVLDSENDEGPQSQASTGVYVLNDENASVEYVGGWHRSKSSSASFGTYRRLLGANKVNTESRAVVQFNGTAITFLYGTSSAGGSATLLVDGVPQQSVSFAGAANPSKPEFGASATISGLAAGPHTLEIRPVSGAVYVDGFLVTGGGSGVSTAGAFTSGATQSSAGTVAGLGTAVATVFGPANAAQISSLLEWAGGANLAVKLLDPAGGLLAQADSTDQYEVVSQAVSVGGTYKVVITNLSTTPAEYRLTTTPTVRR